MFLEQEKQQQSSVNSQAVSHQGSHKWAGHVLQGDERRTWQQRIAACTPPADAMWLFLIMTMSYSPMRWFTPPPISTAHLSSTRSPGAVFRVSRMRAGCPCAQAVHCLADDYALPCFLHRSKAAPCCRFAYKQHASLAP